MVKKLIVLSVGLLVCSYGVSVEVDHASYNADERSCSKIFCNLGVSNSLNVGGSISVSGPVTASSFITPSGALFNGLRNYAVFANQAALVTGNTVLWAATPAGNLSSGISFSATTGLITLPTSGLFLVLYTVRLDKTPFTGTSVAVVQLQQTVAGTPTPITQAAITNNLATDGITAGVPVSETQLSGYALISVTSSSNNVLRLVVTLPSGFVIPAASGVDANAQMTIMQLN